MEKVHVRPRRGQPSNRGRLKNRAEQNRLKSVDSDWSQILSFQLIDKN